jgi:hypothetical protein
MTCLGKVRVDLSAGASRVIFWITKTAMAVRMKTSRRQLDRLLDPDNPSVTLATLRRAANAVGRNLRVELE